jgi:hypothetical protein
MRALAGADAQIHFTNLSKVSSEYLATRFAAASAESDASACCHTSGIMALIGRSPFETGIDKVCLLDPKAESPLDPQDGDRFSCFLFGVGPPSPTPAQVARVSLCILSIRGYSVSKRRPKLFFFFSPSV